MFCFLPIRALAAGGVLKNVWLPFIFHECASVAALLGPCTSFVHPRRNRWPKQQNLKADGPTEDSARCVALCAPLLLLSDYWLALFLGQLSSSLRLRLLLMFNARPKWCQFDYAREHRQGGWCRSFLAQLVRPDPDPILSSWRHGKQTFRAKICEKSCVLVCAWNSVLCVCQLGREHQWIYSAEPIQESFRCGNNAFD